MLFNPRILVAFPACWLVGAHFLRWGNVLLVSVYLAAPFLLMSGRKWALNLNRVLLWIGTVAWLYTGSGMVDQRFTERRPFARLALIMVAVSAATGAAAWTLGTRTAKEGFR